VQECINWNQGGREMRALAIVSLTWVCVQSLSAFGFDQSQPTQLDNTASAHQAVAKPASASESDDPGHGVGTQNGNPSLAAAITKQRVTFKSGQLTLVGFLFKPEGPGPFPAIVWNHGSEKGPGVGPQFDAVANVFVPAGYVVFAPIRRGQGYSQGTYIGTEVELTRKTQGTDAANREMVHLMESEQLDDQLAGLSYLKMLPYIDISRLVVAGCSYGGIETLLAAERGAGYKAAIALSPAALSWQANPQLQRRLLESIRNINIPVLLLQPTKDASLEPSRVLGGEFKRLGKSYSGKVYAAVGPEDEQGHCFGGARGTHVWAQDVLDFVSSAVRTSVTK
jgi:carboxymethylenebutenolidase